MVFDHDNDRTLVDGEVAVGDPVFFGAEGVAEAVGSPNGVFIGLSINVSVSTAAAIVQGGCTGCVTRGKSDRIEPTSKKLRRAERLCSGK